MNVRTPIAPPCGGITELDAVALSQAIRSRQLSCVETLEAFLAQVDRVNALVALQERDGLQRQAMQRDAQLARGEWLGPLHGFPQAPKDIMPAAGMVTTRGSPIYRGQVSPADTVVFGAETHSFSRLTFHRSKPCPQPPRASF